MARIIIGKRAVRVGEAYLLGTIPAGGTFPDDFVPAAPDIYAGNRLMSRVLNTLTPRTCLSCGAKTNDQGEIPCGH